MSRIFLFSTALIVIALWVGCSPPAPPTGATIPGAHHLTFRCVQTDGSGAEMADGLPLEGCGCTELVDGEESRQIRQLGRVECLCADSTGQKVSHVVAGDCGDETCEPKRENGDWIPSATGGVGTVPCDPRGNGQLRAYVGSNNEGSVSVLDISGGQALRGGGNKRILDVSRTIPGVTALYVDDLISDLESDPEGRFVFTVNSSTGTLSVMANDAEVRPAFNLDLGRGPLFNAAVIGAGQVSQPADAASTPRVSKATAWIAAPIAGEVLEVDLDAISALLAGGEGSANMIRRCFALSSESACEQRLLPTDGQTDGKPSQIAVSWVTQRLVVGHAAAPVVTIFDLTGQSDPVQVPLRRSGACADGYLANTVSTLDDPTCGDGIDNDADGAIDGDDTDCVLIGSEAPIPECPQLTPCADGIDNDQDGLIDGLDLNCQVPAPYWEGPVPACADGRDNDEDGLVDRADPGCQRESDASEGDIERGDACDNGEDDDADGLIDDVDPGCSDPAAGERYPQERQPECGDGIDNDFDGLIDFIDDNEDGVADEGSDPDCFAAGDRSEGASAVQTGPTSLTSVTVPFPEGDRHFLYAVDGSGGLSVLELPTSDARFYRTRLTAAVLSSTVRQFAHSVSLLLVTGDKALRQLFAGIPEVIQTHTGTDTFARYPLLKSASPDTWVRLIEDYGPVVQDFYSVIDGGAYRVERMDELCRLEECSTEGEIDSDDAILCSPGRRCIESLCVPDACDDEAPCPEEFECIGGTCLRACSAASDCLTGEGCTMVELANDSSTYCRSRCSLTSEGALVVDSDTDPLAAAGEYGSVELDAAAVEPNSAGLVDPIVIRKGRMRVWHGEQNAYVNAKQRTPMLTTVPQFTVATTSPRPSPERYATFCQLHQTARNAESDASNEEAADVEESEPARPMVDCLPVGFTAEDGDLREKTVDEEAESNWNRLDNYSGIQVRETRADRLFAETHRLVFQGELPNSLSRTGVFELSQVEGEWNLLDYNTDYCGLGVEVGDVVLFDRFIPETSNSQNCTVFDLRTQTGPAEQRLEPLRYVVKAVGPYRLTLEPDTRTTYSQIPKNDYSQPPQPASPPPVPAPECVSQLLTYRVRVADNQWLLEGALTGFRHPWVRNGSECVKSDTRLSRNGRARLNEVFENEWFRFKIGYHEGSLNCEALEDGDGCLPYMLGTRYEFSVQPGTLYQRKLEVAGVPKEMRWLPNDDRLYVVDEQFRTVIELLGFNIFQGPPIEARRYR